MPVNVRIPDDLRDRIDAVRGKVKREPWIRAALNVAVRDQSGAVVADYLAFDATHDDTGADRDG